MLNNILSYILVTPPGRWLSSPFPKANVNRYAAYLRRWLRSSSHASDVAL